MADKIVVYWRDIPAQVIVKKGRKNAKRELTDRFSQAIDMAAMRSGAAGTDEYLSEWRRGEPEPVSDDLEAEVEMAANALELEWPQDKLIEIAKIGGRLPDD